MKLVQVCLFGLVFMLLGCVHYKEYPFPHSQNTNLDPQLVGTWKFENTKNKTNEHDILVFTVNQEKNMYEVYVGKSLSKHLAYTSTVKNKNYLNIQEQNTNNLNLLKYKVSGDRLILWLLNEVPIAKSIHKKEISGDVSSNMPVLPSTDIYLWENAASIKKYILLHDKELFPEPTYLIRTQSPTSSK